LYKRFNHQNWLFDPDCWTSNLGLSCNFLRGQSDWRFR